MSRAHTQNALAFDTLASAPLANGSTPAASPTEAWTSDRYLNEPALSAISPDQSWLAIVSLKRARLVYLGPADRSKNLLRVTETATRPSSEVSPGWSGHVVWLRREKGENWAWPPPAEWEFEAAQSFETQDETLALKLNQVDLSYPPLARRYRWSANSLLCEIQWTAQADNRFLSINTLHLPAESRITLPAVPTPHLPYGFARLARGFTPEPHFESLDGLTRKGDAVQLTLSGTPAKYAFPAQTISAKIGGYQLHMSRGSPDGQAAGDPFDTLLTHVWIGTPDEGRNFYEIEQASSYLDAPAGEKCGSRILLEPAKL